MVDHDSTVSTPGPRHRQTHRKSRYGCKACKSRRLKCDEQRPRCKRCIVSESPCNYGLDLATSLTTSSLSRHQPDHNRLIWTNINEGLDANKHTSKNLRIGRDELALLHRFQVRTILASGNGGTIKVYQDNYFRLASQNPFLMHIILSMTMQHDRYLGLTTSASTPAAEAYHYGKGITLFNRALSGVVHEDTKDALWCASVLLGGLSMALTEPKTPQDSWPLTPAEPGDLDWLKLSEGKQAVWQIAQPDRATGVFRDIVLEFQAFPAYARNLDISELPDDYLQIFKLDALSTPESNPYHLLVLIVGALRDTPCNHATAFRFLAFITQMPLAFRNLLELRDARALLLLAMWFGRLLEYTRWWVYTRARVQCPSICLYLDKCYGDDAVLQRLLDAPKRACGLLEPLSG